MAREWGKTLSSHVSEPRPTEWNNDNFWEHLRNKKVGPGMYRKYAETKKSAWLTVRSLLEVALALIIFGAAIYKLGVQFV